MTKAATKRTPRKRADKALTKPAQVLAAEIMRGQRHYGPPDGGRTPARDLVRRYGRWVYKCATINANCAASIPLRLFSIGSKELIQKTKPLGPRKLDYRTKAFMRGRCEVKPCNAVMKKLSGNQDDLTEITNHPILDLFGNINEWDEGFSFLHSTFVDMDIFGQHYWAIIEAGGQPVELWRLRPQITRPIPDQEKFISGFLCGYGVGQRQFLPEEVIWYRIADPDNPWGVLGPLAAWLKTIDADYAMEAFQEDMFARGGSPDWMVISKLGMTAEQKRAYRAEYRSSFGRMTDRREHIAFSSGDVTLEKLTDSPKELDFNASQIAKRNEIANAFDVPITLLEQSGVVANSREGMNQYKLLSIWPRTTRIEQAWNQRFIPRWSENLVLVFDNPLEEDRTIRIQERASQLGAGYTINEIREQDGEEPLDDPNADVPMVAAGLTTLDRAVNPPEPVDPFGGAFGGGDEEEEPEKKPADDDEKALLRKQCEIIERNFQLLEKLLLRNGTMAPDAGSGGETDSAESGRPRGADAADGTAGRKQADSGADASQLEVQGEADSGVGGADGEAVPCAERDCGHGAAGGGGVSQKALWLDVHCDTSVLEAQVREIDDHIEKLWKALTQEGLPEDGGVRGFRARMVKLFGDQADQIIEQMGAPGVNALIAMRAVVEEPKWIQLIADAARPFMTRAIEIGGKAGLAKLPDLPSGVGFDVTNPKVQEFVENHTVKLAKSVQGSTSHKLEQILGDGMEQGESIGQLSERVKDWGGEEVSGARAENIARTESTRAYEAGQEEAWKESGVVMAKKWLLAEGACSLCQAAAAQYASKGVPLGAPFYARGSKVEGADGAVLEVDYSDIDAPPLHPQCRCDTLPVLIEDGG